VPADPAALARWLGWSDEDVKDGLTERVRSFFSEVEGEFISPQLEEHHKKQMRRRTGLSDGGKKGAERRWKKKQSEDEMAGSMTSPITSPSETDKSIASPLTSSIASFNTIKLNSIKSNSVFKEEDLRDDWLDGYDSVPEQETVISNQEKVRVRV
jgi:hypothetical protein